MALFAAGYNNALPGGQTAIALGNACGYCQGAIIPLLAGNQSQSYWRHGSFAIGKFSSPAAGNLMEHHGG